jgi:hypothetical protein
MSRPVHPASSEVRAGRVSVGIIVRRERRRVKIRALP